MSKVSFEDKLTLVPGVPGCYLMKDAGGVVLYVGKARALKARLRSYFQAGAKHEPKVAAMLDKTQDFEYIITDTEREALVLESNLIKELRPYYNIRIKDDKHYPYLRLAVQDSYPRLSIVRRVNNDKARYFGPYPNAAVVRDLFKLLRRIIPLMTCAREVAYGVKNGSVCLNYHLKQCLGVCSGEVSEADYRESVKKVELLLEGKHKTLVEALMKQMEQEAAKMNYERAATLRDQVRAIESLAEKQKFDAAKHLDRDIVAVAGALEEAAVTVFHMREGKVVGRETIFLACHVAQSKEEIMSAFVAQYYATSPELPKEIILDVLPADQTVLEEALSGRKGSKVVLSVPQRGANKAMVELALRNAAQALADRWVGSAGKDELAKKGLAELAHHLELAGWPMRIECYDISHVQGNFAVGSMVVFVAGQPARSLYRRFRIKWVVGQNDYAALHEVLTRRLSAYRQKQQKFTPLPDLVIIDGGRGQLSAALDAFRQEECFDVPVVALAKAREEVFLPGREKPLVLPPHTQGHYLLQRVRDEAHRFALAYHQKLRAAAQVSSRLESCPGIGASRRAALLKHFGGMQALENATMAEILAVKGLNAGLAARLWAFLHEDKTTK